MIIGKPMVSPKEVRIPVDLKCDKIGFKRARNMYEDCVNRKYKIYQQKKHKEIQKNSICQSLEQFITDCTVASLENCYSKEHIHDVIKQQRILVRYDVFQYNSYTQFCIIQFSIDQILFIHNIPNLFERIEKSNMCLQTYAHTSYKKLCNLIFLTTLKPFA